MTPDEAWLLKEKYSGEKTEGFFTDCKQLKSGEPLAYVIGHIPFLNTKIFLDSRPLIPRPETEFWVEKVMQEIKTSKKSDLRILDLCAGSGCVGVAVLKEIDNAFVDFAEIDVHHHPTIVKNITENGIDVSRTHVFGGSLFENVHTKYDYILTNPPYIDQSLDRTEESVTKFEPHEALYGGTNGLELIEEIVEKASHFLNSEGILYVEHEPEQVERIATLAKSRDFASVTFKDQYDVLRYTRLTRNSN